MSLWAGRGRSNGTAVPTAIAVNPWLERAPCFGTIVALETRTMNAPIILAELLFPLLLGNTRAPSNSVDLHRDAHSVQITITERARGERPARTQIELSDQGKVHLWVASGEARRFCEVETARDSRSDELVIELRCSPDRNAREDLSVEARAAARRGKTMVLARLERADGHTLEVTATLR